MVIVEQREKAEQIPDVHDKEHTESRHKTHIVVLDHVENVTL